MNMLGKAIAIASKAFQDKTDKAGQPYILHCLRVMAGVSQGDSELMQAAILHDLVEDTLWSFDALRDEGFSERVVNILRLITHDKEKDSYEAYIKRISTCQDAKAIKRADLIDNSNITRLKGLRQKDFERIEKYHKAFVYLSE